MYWVILFMAKCFAYLGISTKDFECIIVALTVLLHALCKLPIALDVVLKGLLMSSASLDFGEFVLQLLQPNGQVLVILIYGSLDGHIRVGN